MQVPPEEIGQKLQNTHTPLIAKHVNGSPTFSIGALISSFGFSSDAAHKQFQGIASLYFLWH